MKLPEVSRALRKLSIALDRLGVQHMLIGGYALPAYGRIRATQDIDIAVAVDNERSVKLQAQLAKLGSLSVP